MVVILLGPPGAGKGTQGVLLAEAMAWRHISTGDLLRAARREGTDLGRDAQRYMDAGELVPDRLIIDLVREVLAELPADRGVVFDGFPRTVAQAEALDGVLNALGRRVDRVVVVEAPDDVLVKRISGRRSSPSGAVYNVYFNPPKVAGICDETGEPLIHREDDRPETVRKRLEVYRQETEPLIRFYEGRSGVVRTVDGDQPVDAVQERVRTVVYERGQR